MTDRHSPHSERKFTAKDIAVDWLGAFIGIGALAWVVTSLPEAKLLVIGSFGASAVLIYGSPKAPFAQPRNLIGGHVLSALVGMLTWHYLPDVLILQEAFAVATAIALMQLTRTMHPPGGATALIAVIGGAEVHSMGIGFIWIVFIGVVILFAIALLVNNAFSRGSYPTRWS
jgi:CBS-domain-containing membrane protein